LGGSGIMEHLMSREFLKNRISHLEAELEEKDDYINTLEKQIEELLEDSK
jgi:predicted RNase H-like nuclease (RuvC/YqgF family)